MINVGVRGGGLGLTLLAGVGMLQREMYWEKTSSGDEGKLKAPSTPAHPTPYPYC